MEILYLLIPLSTVLILLIVAVFGWAVHQGQFEDLEREGGRILEAEPEPIDKTQQIYSGLPEESPQPLQHPSETAP